MPCNINVEAAEYHFNGVNTDPRFDSAIGVSEKWSQAIIIHFPKGPDVAGPRGKKGAS